MVPGVRVLPDRTMSAYRIYIADSPISNSTADKLYKDLIQTDAHFCLDKVNGSITLHYSNGVLAKLHENRVR